MAIKGARSEHRRVTAHLLVRDAARAVEFYTRAFGAAELYRSAMPDGNGIHAHLKIGDSMVMVSDERPDSGEPGHADLPSPPRSPQSLGGTSTVLELYVDDADAAFRRAVDAGATPTLPVSDTFWGDRYGWVTDPFGHIWALATVKEELTPDEVSARMREYAAQFNR
jgi:PhnB protein